MVTNEGVLDRGGATETAVTNGEARTIFLEAVETVHCVHCVCSVVITFYHCLFTCSYQSLF